MIPSVEGEASDEAQEVEVQERQQWDATEEPRSKDAHVSLYSKLKGPVRNRLTD